MYLHLGAETSVNEKDIIGIFDIENTSVSKHTKDFLYSAEKNKRITNVSSEMPKSFVVCKNKDGESVYISQIAPSTLRKRAELKV